MESTASQLFGQEERWKRFLSHSFFRFLFQKSEHLWVEGMTKLLRCQ